MDHPRGTGFGASTEKYDEGNQGCANHEKLRKYAQLSISIRRDNALLSA
jgi:hypothetical protein